MQSANQKLSFTKQERLKSKKRIREIFDNGQKIKKHPFVLTYLEEDMLDDEVNFPAQIVVSIPKRVVKFANKRNRLKRQIKETYRLNKAEFYEQLKAKHKKVALFLIYTGKEKVDYQLIEKKLVLLLKQLSEQL
jgi:ribonuclease P protein component